MKPVKIQKVQLSLFPYIGGKKWLRYELNKTIEKSLVNKEITAYHEPFCGALGAFINIYETLLKNNITTVHLSDVSVPLINFYKSIQLDSDLLLNKFIQIENAFFLNIPTEIILMKREEEDKNKLDLIMGNKPVDFFNTVKKEFNIRKLNYQENGLNEVDFTFAAQLMFLQKHCFNGIYRENSKGEYNVPFNKMPKVYKIDDVKLALDSVKCIFLKFNNLTIEVKDFQEIEYNNYTLYYLDPPYVENKNTVGKNKYSASLFENKQQSLLIKNISQVNFIYSNHASDILINEFNRQCKNPQINFVNRKNIISSNKESRKDDKIELLISQSLLESICYTKQELNKQDINIPEIEMPRMTKTAKQTTPEVVIATDEIKDNKVEVKPLSSIDLSIDNDASAFVSISELSKRLGVSPVVTHNIKIEEAKELINELPKELPIEANNVETVKKIKPIKKGKVNALIFNPIRYLGAKTKLLDFLDDSLLHYLDKGGKFFDGFSGTGVVSQFVASKYNQNGRVTLSAGDISKYAKTLFNILNFKFVYPKERDFIFALNEFVAASTELHNGIFTSELSKDGKPQTYHEDRLFFSKSSGEQIDAMRYYIQNKRNEGKVEEAEILNFFLLVYINRVAQTTGVFGAYLKDEIKELKVSTNLFLSIYQSLKIVIDVSKTKNAVEFFEGDILENLNKIEQQDVIYLDPPYVTRRYESNYHVLNFAVDPDFTWESIKPNTKTAMPLSIKSNPFGSRQGTLDIFDKMIHIASQKCTYLGISYSSDGVVNQDDIEQICRKYNLTVKTFSNVYSRYKSNKERDNGTKKEMHEFLWLITQKKEKEELKQELYFTFNEGALIEKADDLTVGHSQVWLDRVELLQLYPISSARPEVLKEYSVSLTHLEYEKIKRKQERSEYKKLREDHQNFLRELREKRQNGKEVLEKVNLDGVIDQKKLLEDWRDITSVTNQTDEELLAGLAHLAESITCCVDYPSVGNHLTDSDTFNATDESIQMAEPYNQEQANKAMVENYIKEYEKMNDHMNEFLRRVLGAFSETGEPELGKLIKKLAGNVFNF